MVRGRALGTLALALMTALTGCARAQGATSAAGSGSHPVTASHAVPATGADTYCRAARSAVTAGAFVPPRGDVGMNGVAQRVQATHALLDAAPAPVREDIRLVLTDYEEFVDAENGDVSPDHAGAIQRPSFDAALARIDGYSRTECGIPMTAAPERSNRVYD